MKKHIKINKGVIILSVLLAVILIYCFVYGIFMNVQTKKIRDICDDYFEDFAKFSEFDGDYLSRKELLDLKDNMRAALGKYFIDDEDVSERVFKSNDEYYDYMNDNHIQLRSCEIKAKPDEYRISFDGFNKATISVYVDFSYIYMGKRVNSQDSYYDYYYQLSFERSGGKWYITYADSMYDTAILTGGMN